jgi:hypothetical protein
VDCPALKGEINMKEICSLIHKTNPYENFDADKMTVDMEGWNSDHPIFADLINKAKPNRIIEVGTWKGASAIHMANLIRKANIDAEIICVDTFLGWPGAELKMQNGFPLLYWQFLTNVVKSGFKDIITPFPQTSELAAYWLKDSNIKANLIYIDGSHWFASVYDDLVRYLPLVETGGYLFGDDYSRDDVRRAVTLFEKTTNIEIQVFDEKWVIHKTKDAAVVDPHCYLEKGYA